MCITVKKEYVTKKPMRAYKIVETTSRVGGKDAVFKSPMLPSTRMRQHGSRSNGKTLKYEIGRVTESPIPKTAGIYLHKTKKSAFDHRYSNHTVVRVTVPAKTKVRIDGGIFEDEIFCAAKVKVEAVAVE